MLLGLVISLALAGAPVTGVVKDTSGGAVPGASVVARPASGGDQQTVTGPDGTFTFADAPSDATLIVRAGGFAEKREPVSSGPMEIVLTPATLFETVTVTATRTEQRLGDTPASVAVLSSEQIKQSPAIVADDVLRQLPTFSLFRRTSSIAAHPTTQGVSLRGIGPSGVSRSLVLIDGIPFNDPFGGWVSWSRVPLEAVDRIEVVESTNSSLYGNYAMGGVINIASSRPSRRTIEFKPQYGNLNTPKLDLFGSDVWGKVGVTVDGSYLTTDGFPNVAPSERGIIDDRLRVNYRNFNAKFDYSPASRVKTFFRTGYFTEKRHNGKINEDNDTQWKTLAGGVRAELPDGSSLQVNLFGDIEDFHSTFVAVNSTTSPGSKTTIPRSSVRLTLDQRVPTDAFGSSALWSRSLGHRNLLSGGADFHWVDGESREDAYNAVGAVVSPVQASVLAIKRQSGGTQNSLGGFVQDVITPVDRLTITLSGRVDHWRNYNAHNFESNYPSGTPTANNKALPGRDDTVFSPRAAAMYRISDKVNAWGSYGYGFRAPTLNELYRQFRVGALLTLANENLGPERLKGGEFGVNLSPARNLTVRTTWYDNRIENPVSNVTIATNTQQRQNLGRTRVWGVQTDAEYRIGDAWRVGGGYLYNNAKVVEFKANPALVGNYLPQVPAHRGSFRVAFADPKLFTAVFGVQALGSQYDDDQNTRVVPGYATPGLPKYGVADLTVSRALTREFDVFFGAQNLFNQTYYVGTLPTTIGSPRLYNVGLRLRLSPR